MSLTTSELDRLAADFTWTIAQRAQLTDGVWRIDGNNSAAGTFAGWLHQELFVIEDQSIWFSWRNRLIGRALTAVGAPEALWDVGAGNGVVAKYLQNQGITVVAIETGFDGARSASQRGVREVICGSLEELHLPVESLPAVGVFDVLEHLEHPDELLSEIHRILQPGGILAVTVPAFRLLWSDVDIASGHYRRYRRSELRRLLVQAGFDLEYLNYHFVAAALPLACWRSLPWRLGRRRASDKALHQAVHQAGTSSAPLKTLARIMMQMEASLGRHFQFPLGTSILAVARKR